MIRSVDADHFTKDVIENARPVVVDFWAEWCGPCKALGALLQSLSSSITTVDFVKVNVDEQVEVASRYGITALPTLVLFQNGQEVARQVGLVSEETLRKWVMLGVGEAHG